jgi:hypothetical protein
MAGTYRTHSTRFFIGISVKSSSGFSKCRRDLKWPSTKARRTKEKKQQTMEEATGSVADRGRCSGTWVKSISKSNISHRLESFEDSILRLYGESDTVTKPLNDLAWQEVHTLGHLNAAARQRMSRAER